MTLKSVVIAGLGIAILALSCTAYGPGQQKEGTQKHDLKAQGSNQNKGDTYNISISEETESPAQNKAREDREAQEKAQDRRIQTWLVILTAGLVLVGFMQAGIFGVTLIVVAIQAVLMGKHAGHFEKLAGFTNKNAEAARDSASAILNSERAWVEIDFGAPEVDPRAEGFAVDDYGDYSIQIKNHGRTIARIEGFQFHTLVMNGELEIGAFDTKTVDFSTLLGSGDTSIAAGAVNFISEIKDWEPFRNDQKRAYARIGVTYRDVVDSRIVHQTFAVYVWNIFEEEPLRLSKYNSYT